MKIAITGSGGFVESNLVPYLVGMQNEVTRIEKKN